MSQAKGKNEDRTRKPRRKAAAFKDLDPNQANKVKAGAPLSKISLNHNETLAS